MFIKKRNQTKFTVKFQGLSGSAHSRSKRTPVGINLQCRKLLQYYETNIKKKINRKKWDDIDLLFSSWHTNP
jgi:hypothetical protein